jgi:hypothetical protein
MKKVVDISTFDKSVDFAKVKASGYVGVIIRAGYGQTNVDDYFREHIQQANKAGLPVGIYWFSYAYSQGMAQNEARKCIELIKKYKISMPVFWDYEYDSDRYAKSQGHPVSNNMLNSMAVAFCSEIRKAGYVPGIYFNKDYRDNRFDRRLLKQYAQWFAYYNKTLDDDAKDVDLWQYTSTEEVPGIDAPREDVSYLLNKGIIYGSVDVIGKPEETAKEKYVKALQTALNVSYGLHMPVDGSYGKLTESGVRLNYLYYRIPTIKNAHVSWFQGMLNRDPKAKTKLDVDGSFGKLTRARLKDFQEEYKLLIDGYGGHQTHMKLIEVASNE